MIEKHEIKKLLSICMEWRRAYPTVLLNFTILGITISTILVITGLFIDFPIFQLGLTFLAISVGILIAILIETFYIKRDESYYCEIFLSTEDLIELIKRAEINVGRIRSYKMKDDSLYVLFRSLSYFKYRPSDGRMLIPSSSMKRDNDPRFPETNTLEVNIEYLHEKKAKRDEVYSKPQRIDSLEIKRIIEKLIEKDRKKNMGYDKTPYSVNSVNLYLLYFLGFMVLFGIFTLTTLLILLGGKVSFSLIYGFFFGAFGGFILFIFSAVMFLAIYGDFDMPVKFRLTETDIDLSDREERLRTSILYGDVKEVKRFRRTNILRIHLDPKETFGGGYYAIKPKKLLLRMTDDQIKKFQYRLKHPIKKKKENLSNPDVYGENWTEGNREDEFYEVGDDDVEELEERVIYYLKV
jgi:hypothetical protein